MERYVCHDCGRNLEKNEEYMPYKVEGQGYPHTNSGGGSVDASSSKRIGVGVYVKCKTCHEQDPVLRNFKRTEVYSRVVGYIRPVKQWNRGKQEEFKDRREYVVEQPSCC